MKCEEIKKKAANFAAGDIAETECGAFNEHLKTCAGCRAEIESFKRLNAALKGLGAVRAPKDFANKVMLSISEERSKNGFTEMFFAFSRPALFFASAMIIALIALDLGIKETPAAGNDISIFTNYIEGGNHFLTNGVTSDSLLDELFGEETYDN